LTVEDIVSTQAKPYTTPEEYLEIERAAEYKSQYYQGEMFAMAGASEPHNMLALNVMGEIRQQLRSRQCRAYGSDMRVRVSGTGLYTYPDGVVVCGQPQFTDDHVDTLLNPDLIVEVLSPSTESYDRGRKFEQYRSIESLTGYLLVASDRMHVDLYSRQAGGRWLLTDASLAEETIELPAIDCALKLADLYEKVDLPDQASLRSQM